MGGRGGGRGYMGSGGGRGRGGYGRGGGVVAEALVLHGRY